MEVSMSSISDRAEKLPHETISFLPNNDDHYRKRERRFWEAIGLYGLGTLVLGSIAVIASAVFLSFFWATSRRVIQGQIAPQLWHMIVSRGWTTRAVTLSTVVIRSAVAFQAGLISAMMAALLLEKNRTRISKLPVLSILRAANTGPSSLAWLTVGNTYSFSSLPYIILILTALVATIISQAFSTILLQDLSNQSILLSSNARNVTYGINYNGALGDTDVYSGINYWKTSPTNYPRFAEYSEPASSTEDGVMDTGRTYRAYLPFSSAQDRMRLRNFTGSTTVLDLRTVCVRPTLKITSATAFDDLLWFLNDTASLSRNYTQLSYPTIGLSTAIGVAGSNMAFNCSIALRDSGTQQQTILKYSDKLYWKTTLCSVDELANLNGGIRTGMDWYTRTYLILNTTGISPDWETAGAFDTWRKSDSEAWTTLSSPKTLAGLSASVCFMNPLPWDYQVNIHSKEDSQEPSIGWNNVTGAYITESIRQFYGAVPGVPFEDRGLLQLEPRANWTAASSDFISDKTTVNFLLTALDEGFTATNMDTTSLDGGVILTPLNSNGGSAIHRVHIAIFQDIIQKTSNPALALQTLLTILTQMAFYDFLPQFDVNLPAQFSLSTIVNIPHQWKGFGTMVAVLAVHLFVLSLTALLFFLNTKHSLLGNSWQAVAQVVSERTRPILNQSFDMTDREVEKVLKASGRDQKIFGVSRLSDM
ncbi:hypothetical protein BGZ57DRAFT_285238 [Hyaloscypha finlandica]|nr:hypothetical protein BGZ57DRAFT_285238 [Hyaloscypha finlandica]